jgi:hypothetical protein
MNLFKRLAVPTTLIAALFALSACAGETSSSVTSSSVVVEQYGTPLRAYGVVHKEYVGEALVVVKGSEILHVKIDEAFLPHDFARITDASAAANPALVVEIKGANDASLFYAKNVAVDGKLYTAAQLTAEERTATGTARYVKYTASDVPNLYVHVKTEANAKAYYEAFVAGKVFVANADGSKNSTLALNTPYYMELKSIGKYWPAAVPTVNATSGAVGIQIGWRGNMAILEAAIEEMGFALTPTRDTANANKIKFGDVVTGATMTDYLDYFNLAKAAYNKR